MSLLYPKHPIVINPELAVAIGLNEAMLLQQLHYWLSETTSGVEYGGRRWIYNTYKEWREKGFEFFSEATIKRAFASLIAQQLVDVAQLSDDNRDRTNFYTINYENELISGQVNLTSCKSANCTDAKGQSDPMQKVTLDRCKRPKRALVHTETTTEIKDKKIFSSRNSDESPDREKIADFKSRHPDAEVFTPSGKSWGTKQDLECAAWIFERVKILNPAAKQPNWTEWANDVRLMRQIDGHTHRDIAGLFKKASQDNFWWKNILSPSKLRAKWDDLKIKLGDQPHANNSGESTAVQRVREERTQWERERRGSGVATMGPDGSNLREPLDCEEWQQTDSALDHSDWEYDQRPDDERL